MLDRVVLNGSDVAAEDVLAELTIRHGRGGADDGPLASTVSLTLVNVTRELVASFSAGDELELVLVGGDPRFRGRITDAKLNPDGLSVIAVSSLAWLSRRPVGFADWPQEPWSARVLRAFNEAGFLLTWSEGAGSWAEAAGAWADFGIAGRLTLEVGDPDPLIAARVANVTTLGAYLADLFDSEPAAIANLPDGTVLVQAFTSRAARAELELDPDVIAYAPAWEQTDAVENELTLVYEDGAIVASSPSSVERFERRPARLDTELALEAAATAAASLRISRRAFPRWLAAPVELLELEPDVAIGSPVRLHALPDWAPAAGYLGIVEGWEDFVAPSEEAPGTLAWTMQLFFSDPRLSGGFGVLWFGVPAETSWAEAPPASWAAPETLNLGA